MLRQLAWTGGAVARIADVATRLSKRVSSMKKNVEIVATAVK